MALKNKYQREKQQYSNDGGMTWLDVSPAKYRRGRLIEEASEDCNTVEWREVLGSWFCIGYEPTTEYRWVVIDGQYECVGYDKHTKEKKQQSTDGGVTWTDVVPLETKAGSLIQANSEDCGYVPPTPGGYENQYLTFEAIEDGTFKFSKDVSYSIDNGETWTVLARGTASPTITTGNKIMWKAEISPSTTNPAYFSSTGRYNVEGNAMSLLFGDNFKGQTDLTGKNYALHALFSNNSKLISAENLILPAKTLTQYCYEHMFLYCTSLTTAPELPATTLARDCYSHMFYGCSSLTTAPELPATTLATHCYYYMFYGCSSLTTAPQLPATTLASNCYDNMFDGCTGLTTAPILPATTLATHCYEEMFYACTSLVNAPALPATTLADYCYYRMFISCISLTTAPALPATTLASSCYQSMFDGCTSLTSITCLATDISAKDCTNNWVSYVASTGTFTKASSMTSWTTGLDGIPEGWTIQNA